LSNFFFVLVVDVIIMLFYSVNWMFK